MEHQQLLDTKDGKRFFYGCIIIIKALAGVIIWQNIKIGEKDNKLQNKIETMAKDAIVQERENSADKTRLLMRIVELQNKTSDEVENNMQKLEASRKTIDSANRVIADLLKTKMNR